MPKKPKKTPKRTRSSTAVKRQVWQTVIKVTVLSEDGPIGDDVDLAGINYAISEGDCIGEVEITSRQRMDPRWVRRKLVAIGNDGTFFDSEDDDED
jgi:hypothetical protein